MLFYYFLPASVDVKPPGPLLRERRPILLLELELVLAVTKEYFFKQNATRDNGEIISHFLFLSPTKLILWVSTLLFNFCYAFLLFIHSKLLTFPVSSLPSQPLSSLSFFWMNLQLQDQSQHPCLKMGRYIVPAIKVSLWVSRRETFSLLLPILLMK